MKSADELMGMTMAWLKGLAWAAAFALPAMAYGAGVAMVTDLQGKATVTADGRPRDLRDTRGSRHGRAGPARGGRNAGRVVSRRRGRICVQRAGRDRVQSRAAGRDQWRQARKTRLFARQGRQCHQDKTGRRRAGCHGNARIPHRRAYPAPEPAQDTHPGTQPEFRWQALQPGVKYQIEITDDTGRTVQEAQVDTASFKLPAGVPLKEGVPYTWEVSARLPDGRKYSSSADFAVAPADVRAQAEALRPAASAPLSTRVAYAAWLDQMELKDEARKYWKAAAAERPDRPR